MKEVVRLEAYFSGWVQGVGFRYTTERLAKGFMVGGYVRNLPDGRVEVVCEGEKEEIERFIEAIKSRMGRYIESLEMKWGEARLEFDEFGVRF